MTRDRPLPISLSFSTSTCIAETLPDSICFFNESASCVQGDCKFTCDAADRAHIPCFIHRKCASQESCRVPWVHFPCVFSSKICLGFTSDCEFTCDAANRSRILYLFSTETCVAETLPDSMCFFNESASCIRGDCKFT